MCRGSEVMKSIVNRFTTFIESWPLLIAVVLSLLSVAITPASAECLHDNGDGTHTDPTTGLIWQTCAVGQSWSGQKCVGEPGTYTWEMSVFAADSNRFQNKYDWILPAKEQLEGLFKTECGLMDKRRVWSSSPNVRSPDSAWFVYFASGYVGSNLRSDSNYVRLVRAASILDVDAFKASLAFVIAQYKNTLDSSISSSELKSFIATYEKNDPHGLLPAVKKKLFLAEKREAAEARARELQAYRDAFQNAQSSSSLDGFISSYRGNDPDKLIPKAEAKKRAALAQERQQAERERQQAERDRQQWERDRPMRERREASQRICEAQKTTCLAQCYGAGSCGESSASCGRFVSCESRCREINCY